MNERNDTEIENDLDETADRVRFIGNPCDAVADALMRIPNDVREWALDNVVFLCPGPFNGAAFSYAVDPLLFERDEWDRCWFRIAYIADHVIDGPIEKRRTIIMHEVAHHWLGHLGHAHGLEAFQKREEEVETLLAEWNNKSNGT